LWFLDQLQPGHWYYNCPAAVRLRGELNFRALQRTVTEIVRRHEVLRTRFVSEGGRAVQQVIEAAEVQLPVLDLEELREVEREAEVQRLARVEAARPFVLSAGGLLRVQLLRLSGREQVVLLTMHHIVSDGWSVGILVREVAALYEAYRSGASESGLAELPLQYGDYAEWQREWLSGAELEEQLGYWKRQLGGELAVLELPADRARPAVQSHRGATVSFGWSEELSRGLKELSRREGVTLFMTLLAGFAVLLHRYTGEEDVVVGTVVAGRNRVEVEGLIGFFVNMLVLRTDLSGGPTFRELLQRVREVSLEAYAHQELPFEKLVEELRSGREEGEMPLFRIAFGVQNAPQEQLQLEGLTLQTVNYASEAARYDLTLWMVERGQQLQGHWTYSTELFERERIERMSGHLRQLLQSAVQAPDTRLHALEMVTPEERVSAAEKEKDRKEFNLNKFVETVPKPIQL
jgi:non-ribosomal peptide synthetase component F